MKNFKKSFICDVCGKKLSSPHFRIEWGNGNTRSRSSKYKYDFIQVCHNECSYGDNPNSTCTSGDIIFDQLPYTADATYNRLNELKEENPNTHGIPAEEYDQEHFSWQSMVLASSEKVDF